tara:strand:- start:207 stop:335 length:129 start_codon:yes stop_codon:yes gene_type:complete
MSFYISDFMIYVIAVLSMIIVLIMMSNLEKKRIKEEQSKENV